MYNFNTTPKVKQVIHFAVLFCIESSAKDYNPIWFTD